MKIRIEGQALRFRLTQKDVARIHDMGSVDCALQFPSGRTFSYSLVSSRDATDTSVGYDGDSVCVLLPLVTVTIWAESNQVTIEEAGKSCLHVLVEKDFQCLHQPDGRTPDAWPHPLAQNTTDDIPRVSSRAEITNGFSAPIEINAKQS
jgi:hypothetical protein